MNNFKASIILASYNGERYIVQQLESILTQMELNDELIIIDDCSNDNSISLIKKLFEKYYILNTFLFINKKNLGPKKSFEEGLKRATKDIIVLSDQDDVWIKGRLKKIKINLNSFDFCTLNSYLWDGNNDLKESFPLTFDIMPPSRSIIKNIIKPSFIGCHLAFKSKYLKYIIPFPTFVYMHDMYIGIFAILSKSLLVDSSPSMYYRRHPNCYTPIKTSLLFKVLIRLRYFVTMIFVKILLLKSK